MVRPANLPAQATHLWLDLDHSNTVVDGRYHVMNVAKTDAGVVFVRTVSYQGGREGGRGGNECHSEGCWALSVSRSLSRAPRCSSPQPLADSSTACTGPQSIMLHETARRVSKPKPKGPDVAAGGRWPMKRR